MGTGVEGDHDGSKDKPVPQGQHLVQAEEMAVKAEPETGDDADSDQDAVLVGTGVEGEHDGPMHQPVPPGQHLAKAEEVNARAECEVGGDNDAGSDRGAVLVGTGVEGDHTEPSDQPVCLGQHPVQAEEETAGAGPRTNADTNTEATERVTANAAGLMPTQVTSTLATAIGAVDSDEAAGADKPPTAEAVTKAEPVDADGVMAARTATVTATTSTVAATGTEIATKPPAAETGSVAEDLESQVDAAEVRSSTAATTNVVVTADPYSKVL